MDTGLLRPESARRQRIYATLVPYDQRDGCPSSTVAALDNTLYVFLMLDALCLCLFLCFFFLSSPSFCRSLLCFITFLFCFGAVWLPSWNDWITCFILLTRTDHAVFFTVYWCLWRKSRPCLDWQIEHGSYSYCTVSVQCVLKYWESNTHT